MNKIEWKSIRIIISDLKEYANNPRTITEEKYKQLVASIKEDGYHQRIICDSEYNVIGGHQRIKALLDAGYKKSDMIDVLIASRKLTEEEFQRINIRDNLQHGDWDMELLANNFEVDLLIDWGFDSNLLDLDKAAPDTSELDYISKYQVVIDVKDEIEQEDIYSEFKNRGYECKVVSI